MCIIVVYADQNKSKFLQEKVTKLQNICVKQGISVCTIINSIGCLNPFFQNT